MTLPDRFWSKVDKNGPVPEHAPHLGPCWVWLAACTGERKSSGGGYGSFKLSGRARVSHVLAYEDLRGVVPPGKPFLDHLCRNRKCCNPDHLEPVTPQTNTARGASGAEARAATHCARMHLFTESNTIRRAGGRRECRACRIMRRAIKRRTR